MASPFDEYTLLCRRCGYAIEGLPGGGSCPECGEPIAASLPQSRRGTPWQRRASGTAWWRTNALAVRHPWRLMDAVRVGAAGDAGLLAINIIAAGLVHALSIQLAGWCLTGGPFVSARRLLPGAISAVTVSLTLFILTRIERLGIRVVGRARRWRVTGGVARAVCAHASVGWPAGAMVGLALTGVAGAAVRVFGPPGRADGLSPGTLLGVCVLAPGVAGILFFETLVSIMLRRAKFANRTRPTAPGASPPPA